MGRLLILAIVLLAGGGCAAIPLTTAGAALEMAGTAASQGAAVYSLGKLDFSVNADFGECNAAIHAAIADLQLHLMKCEFADKGQDKIVYELEDDRKSRTDVSVDRRTARLCQCRVDVGIFGSEPTAKLIMDRIRHHLPNSGSGLALSGCLHPTPVLPVKAQSGEDTVIL